MCQLCTIAVVGGLGISRLLGVDDLVTSIWIGALILSTSFWSLNWAQSKWPKLQIAKYRLPIVFAMYMLVLAPLAKAPTISKIIVGTALGSTVLLVGIWLDKKQRLKYGKQFFQYQKVVFPVSLLILTSLVMFLVTKYKFV